jgi:transposase
MGTRYVNIDRDTPMMFPVDMRDWLPPDSIVFFLTEAIEQLDISSFSVNSRGTGSEQYPPEMMLELLIFSYMTGRFSSRVIERATYTDIEVRYICGGGAHPDHDTICDFRRRNGEAFKEVFKKTLLLAKEVKIVRGAGGISIDGTKVGANASKHKAVSYEGAGKKITQLELEIEALMKRADEADAEDEAMVLKLPKEIELRKERKAKLQAAREAIEERDREERKEKSEREGKGRPVGGGKVPGNKQINCTDRESRIMKSGDGNFKQAYNAEAAVDTEGSRLIVGGYVTNHCADQRELALVVQSVDERVRVPTVVVADAGFFNAELVKTVEAEGQGPEVYCAISREKHGQRPETEEAGREGIKQAASAENDPTERKRSPAEEAKERMAQRLESVVGKREYKKRKETVEPVFGIIKGVMGFRRFMLRGLDKVNLEWDIVTSAYNIKRIHRLLVPLAVNWRY